MKLPPKPAYSHPNDAKWEAWGRACAEAMRERCAMNVWLLLQEYLGEPNDDGPDFWLRMAENAIRNIQIEEE